jgi:hypothetical protein
MWEQVNDILRGAALRTVQSLADFLPGLVGLLVIVLVTVVVAIVARMAVLRALRGLRFDQRAESIGLGSVADWSVVGGPSLVVARIAMWTILIAGLLAGLSALDATFPAEFARSLLNYIPNIFAALLILLLGTVLARFLARTVLIGAVNLQMQSARLLSVGIRWLLFLLAWVLALEHLGIGRGLLALGFAIVLGGVVLALALAIGLGSRDLVRQSLERRLPEASEQPDKLTHV